MPFRASFVSSYVYLFESTILDFVHCFISNRQPWPSDRGSNGGLKPHQDQWVLWKKRNPPRSAVGPLPGHHERSQCVCDTRLLAQEECIHQDEVHAQRGQPSCRDRRAWALCGRWQGRTTGVAFRSPGELGSPQKWF